MQETGVGFQKMSPCTFHMLAELGVLPWHSERESLPFARVHRHSRQKKDRGRQDRRQDGKSTSSKNHMKKHNAHPAICNGGENQSRGGLATRSGGENNYKSRWSRHSWQESTNVNSWTSGRGKSGRRARPGHVMRAGTDRCRSPAHLGNGV